MQKLSTHVIAFSLGTIAFSILAAGSQVPAQPAWVTAYCADASPCVAPAAETYQGIALAIQWLEDDGSPCLDAGEVLPPGAHPQSACDSPTPSIAHWFLLTRGGPAHAPLQAVDHDVFVATDSPIYSATAIRLPAQYALGAVMAFGLPPTGFAPQAPQFPTFSPAATQTWFELACAESATCGAGGLTQVAFDALLASSPYSTHNHPFGFTLTRPDSLDAVPVSGITGVPQ